MRSVRRQTIYSPYNKAEEIHIFLHQKPAETWHFAGTLTLNHLSVDPEQTLCLGNYTKEQAMEYACLSAQIKSEEAIDLVLIEHTPEEVLWKGKSQFKYIPFNPNDKYTISYVKENDSGKQYRLMKGAPQVDSQFISTSHWPWQTQQDDRDLF